jgi:hypothetical protein
VSDWSWASALARCGELTGKAEICRFSRVVLFSRLVSSPRTVFRSESMVAAAEASRFLMYAAAKALAQTEA